MSSVHTAAKGDCVYSIADLYKIRDWKKIYDAPDNADMKKARPDPNVLMEGDEVAIPDVEPATRKVTASTEEKHKYQVKLPKCLLRVAVHDEEDKPISGKKFLLLVGDKRFEGTTDGDGIVEQRIPFQASTAKLYVFFTDKKDDGEHLYWDVDIGGLEPSDTPRGIQERLNNLGFVCGEVDGKWHDGMDVSLRTFQKSAKIDPNGEPDDATTKKLKEVHGKI